MSIFGFNEAQWILSRAMERVDSGDVPPRDVEEAILIYSGNEDTEGDGDYDGAIKATLDWIRMRESQDAEIAAKIAYGLIVPGAADDDVGATDMVLQGDGSWYDKENDVSVVRIDNHYGDDEFNVEFNNQHADAPDMATVTI